MKYTYAIETFYLGKWVKLLTDTRDFCMGYITACQYDHPRNTYRLMRSDGRVMHELNADAEVGIGMIASYPTAEQYEAAAKRAMEQASRIREQQSKHDARRVTVREDET